MEKTVLIDTNLYLDDPKIIYKLANSHNKILVPITVLKELDKHKFNRDLSYSAREAIRALQDFMVNQPDQLVFDIDTYEGESDERILTSAEKHGAMVATKDVSMSIQAKAKNIESMLHDMVLNNIFNPYVYATVAELMEASGEDTFAYGDKYEGELYEDVLTIFSKLAGRELDVDTWFFIIINAGKKEPIIYANNPLNHMVVRIDNKTKYRRIENDGSPIEARDCYQICAIYALEEAPHTLITGRWGSGKTLLATAHALGRTKKKAFITRAPLGLNPKYDIGFLPGDREEKMMDWLQGFMSALYYLYGVTRDSKDGNGGTYDFVRDAIFPEKFEVVAMNSIQGMSLLDKDTLIVDEAQLITVDYMSMILSRPSETGRLVLLGDIKQTYDVVKPSESGLLKLLRVLPHKYMAYVELQNSYRSPLLEVADKLQDKSIG
jgi:PhoH-like ATPase